ncbi:GNAT family N-acetyltransferase [Jiulongibacter sp. NS-SX5]|uniref:GNAT family N-acetyltransferase n=1 Tax=Jiulongibacter sp. NS-SX5 TaxID=3463854 RepID=UPI00405807D6
MIEIIRAEKEDLSIIQELAYKIWPPTFKDILSDAQMEYMLEMMYSLESLEQQVKDGVVFLLCKVNSKIVGFAGYELNYKNSPKLKLHKLYFLPETQGKGLGKMMINRLAEIGEESEQLVIALNVNRFNKAYDFYLKTGFQKVGSEDIDIGNGYLMEDFILEKKI